MVKYNHKRQHEEDDFPHSSDILQNIQHLWVLSGDFEQLICHCNLNERIYIPLWNSKGAVVL